MQYEVIVRDHKNGHRRISEALLDGIVEQHVIDAMTCETAEDLGLCKICDSQGARCHVMLWVRPHTYAKYCPVLWHDVFKPGSWKVEDLV